MPEPKSTFPPDRLVELGETYRERNAIYGDTYKNFGKVMTALFQGKPVTLETDDDWNRMAIYFHMADKLARYAGNFGRGGHVDSLDDLSVYSMMLQEFDDIVRGGSHEGYVLVDMDHTLSDAEWRDHIIPKIVDGSGFTWDDYHRDGYEDEPMLDAVAMVNALRSHGFRIVIMTSRPEKWRKDTEWWLKANSIKFDELLMRPDPDHQSSPAVKTMLAKQRFGDTLAEVIMLIDDRADVCGAFRELGVTAVQVHRCEGDRNDGHKE